MWKSEFSYIHDNFEHCQYFLTLLLKLNLKSLCVDISIIITIVINKKSKGQIVQIIEKKDLDK